MERRILALDPANRTGWAYVGRDGRRLYGAWNIAKPGDSQPGARLRRFRDGLRELVDRFPVDLLACEDSCLGVGDRSRNTLRMHAELIGVVKMLAGDLGVPLHLYAPMTVKAYAGCAGKRTRSDKTAMCRACRLLLGIETDDDDIADALWVLELARSGRVATVGSSKRRAARASEPQGRLF